MTDTPTSEKSWRKAFVWGGSALTAALCIGLVGYLVGQAGSADLRPEIPADVASVNDPARSTPPRSAGNLDRIGAWTYRESRDKFSDKVSATVSVNGEEAVLGVKCDEPGSIYVMIFMSEYIGGSSNETRNVVIRFDSESAEEQRWRYGDKYAAIFDAGKARVFADRLVGVQRLSVRVFDYEFHPHDETFELGAETERALQRLYETCEVNAQ